MKSRYVSLRKNPAGSPENKKISYPGKGTRFGKHLFFTCLKIEYTLCVCTSLSTKHSNFLQLTVSSEAKPESGQNLTRASFMTKFELKN